MKENLFKNFEKKPNYWEAIKPIGNLSTLVKVIVGIVSYTQMPSPWFRGQKRSDWKLEATINRKGVDNYWKRDELSSVIKYHNDGMHLEKMKNVDTFFAAYYLMQHYKFPTRLLDWTESALLAVYFSIYDHFDSDLSKEKEAALWILDPSWLNKITNDQFDGPIMWPSETMEVFKEHLKYEPNSVPLAILPRSVDERMVLQKSRFTYELNVAEEFSGFDNIKSKNPNLFKLRIDNNSFHGLLSELRLMGISQKSIYPDMENHSIDLLNFVKGRSLPNYVF
jgi:FRG domain-containing protein